LAEALDHKLIHLPPPSSYRIEQYSNRSDDGGDTGEEIF
jgi:hypothetical protein